MPEDDRIPSLMSAYNYIDKQATQAARLYALSDDPALKAEFRARWDAGSILVRASNAFISGKEPRYA